MYNIGDVISYGNQGMCEVIDIVSKTINDTTQEYYVLNSLLNNNTTLFVPTNNETLIDKMHHKLSKEYIYNLIDKIAQEKTEWIENYDERRKLYKTILDKGEHYSILKVIKTLYLQRELLKSEGLKMSHADEVIFKNAEQKLYNEFAYVLDMDVKSVSSHIFSHIEAVQ